MKSLLYFAGIALIILALTISSNFETVMTVIENWGKCQ